MNEQSLTRKNLLWAGGLLFAFAAMIVVRLTWWGDPANSLHQKALDGAFSLIWLASGVIGSTLATALAPLLLRAPK